MRELSGKSQARGRNGWFKPAHINSWAAPQHLVPDPDEGFGGPILFEIWSKQQGRMAPVIVWLTVEDAKVVVGELTNAIVDAQNSARTEVGK